MKKFGMFCVAIAFVAAVAACGSESSTTEERQTGTATATASPTTTAEATATSAPAATAPGDADATINIRNNSFGDPVTVAPGALITIINGDSAEHSVTSRTPGLFDVHIDGNRQQTLTAPTEPGQYEFYCTYHPSMTGTLTVT